MKNQSSKLKSELLLLFDSSLSYVSNKLHQPIPYVLDNVYEGLSNNLFSGIYEDVDTSEKDLPYTITSICLRHFKMMSVVNFEYKKYFDSLSRIHYLNNKLYEYKNGCGE